METLLGSQLHPTLVHWPETQSFFKQPGSARSEGNRVKENIRMRHRVGGGRGPLQVALLLLRCGRASRASRAVLRWSKDIQHTPSELPRRRRGCCGLDCAWTRADKPRNPTTTISSSPPFTRKPAPQSASQLVQYKTMRAISLSLILSLVISYFYLPHGNPRL